MAVLQTERSPKARMTEEELMRLPADGRKWELTDGEAKEVPTAVIHDIIVGTVIGLIRPFAKGRGYVAASQAGFRMINGNIRVPDVSFYRKSRLPNGPSAKFQDGAPDLCIEIISPSEERSEMEQKVREYFASGAVYVWQMFPETETLVVFTSPTQSRTLRGRESIDAGELLPGFVCQVRELFEVE